jgi:hypothetical protein
MPPEREHTEPSELPTIPPPEIPSGVLGDPTETTPDLGEQLSSLVSTLQEGDLRFPRRYDITVQELSPGRWCLNLRETYDPQLLEKHPEVLGETVAALKPVVEAVRLLGAEMRLHKEFGGVSVEVQGPLHVVVSSLLGEFISLDLKNGTDPVQLLGLVYIVARTVLP